MTSKVLQCHGEYWSKTFDCTQLYGSREDELCKFCQNKKVLHIGCTDYPFGGEEGLHKSLDACSYADGVDVDKDGIDRFKKIFNGNFYYSLDEVNDTYDIVLLPEVIEHVSDVGSFLSKVDKINFNILIATVPDVLSCYNNNHFEFSNNQYVEAVHEDHVAWYSPYTLKNVIEKNTKCKCVEFYILGRSVLTIAKKEKT